MKKTRKITPVTRFAYGTGNLSVIRMDIQIMSSVKNHFR